MTTLQAHYGNWSEWDLNEMGIDITKVHEWYIKWDCLNIQREEYGEWEEFEGWMHEDNLDFKRPYEVYCDDRKIENGESIKGGAL